MQWQPHQYLRMAHDVAGEEYVDSRYDEALLVPLTASAEVILMVEPSLAFTEQVLVLPGGCIEAHEPPEVTANRELQEEIGYRADKLDLLGVLRPFVKYLRVTSHIYLARELAPSRLVGDETHEIGILTIPLARFEELLASGQLTDARVIAALYLARAFLADHE